MTRGPWGFLHVFERMPRPQHAPQLIAEEGGLVQFPRALGSSRSTLASRQDHPQELRQRTGLYLSGVDCGML